MLNKYNSCRTAVVGGTRQMTFIIYIKMHWHSGFYYTWTQHKRH